MMAIIIQARMGSTRLPGKILKKLEGKPMLWHVVKRCQKSKLIDKVIVATSKSSDDNIVERFCKSNKILYFRGDLENVLDRYFQTAKKFNVETIVRVTSDCPLIDPLIIDKCVEKFIENDYDYLSNANPGKRTFPRGLDVEVFSLEALGKAHKNARKSYEKEHVTPYIWENQKKEFLIGPTVRATENYRANFRLTVDYPEDLILIQKIYERFYYPGRIIDVAQVILFLKNNPQTASINAHLRQKPFKS